MCLSKFANADYIAHSSGARVTSVKRFIAIKVNACHATHFLHNHRLSPPRLLIAVSLSLPYRKEGEAEGYRASRRSARITVDYTDKIARCINRARKCFACIYTVFQNACVTFWEHILSEFSQFFKNSAFPK